MKFFIIADANFEAKNLEDAFKKLAKHFLYLVDNGINKTGKMSLTKMIFEDGYIEVNPKQTKYCDTLVFIK